MINADNFVRLCVVKSRFSRRLRVNEADRNEQIDDDILQCKADILRAADIVPPYRQETQREAKSQEGSEDAGAVSASTEKSREAARAPGKDAAEAPAESAGEQRERSDIPRFDLAEEIMAEHRKITAVRRRGPSERKGTTATESEAEPGGQAVERFMPAQSEGDKILAEIVARDIERFYQGTS